MAVHECESQQFGATIEDAAKVVVYTTKPGGHLKAKIICAYCVREPNGRVAWQTRLNEPLAELRERWAKHVHGMPHQTARSTVLSRVSAAPVFSER